MTTYLDCNATTPIDPRVREEILHYLTEEYGNAGSRTHEYGNRANLAVRKSRSQLAEIVKSKPEEIIFTSGATESNNIAILGMAEYGIKNNKTHLISTQIEHKAVLEPLEKMQEIGFEVTLLPCKKEGWIDPNSVKDALREDTLMVSVMHVNNETGVIQPIEEISQVLKEHDAFFHTDAAQGFGKDLIPLQNPRVDLISISGHKIYGPKGIGALVTRRRKYDRPPLKPLMMGGGQERGLRPGTLPVHLIVGLGLASELAHQEHEKRNEYCLKFKKELLDAFAPLQPIIHGDPSRTISHTVNLSFPAMNSEAVMLTLKDLVAISNGSACTSTSYELSHVLKGMNLSDKEAETALRWSWCYMTEKPNILEISKSIEKIL